jgi:peptidoglycan/xylan/chitin deacetylase (PgdA/CDA1 family)
MRLLMLAAAFTVACTRAEPIEIAVTVDDLPTHGPMQASSTRLQIATEMLDAFQKHHVPAPVGFVNAGQLEGDPAHGKILQAWTARGYPLGNHTWSHADLERTELAAYVENIDRNQRWLDEAAPGQPRFFRFPYLHEGLDLERRDGVRAHLQNEGYRVAPVTLYFGDWAWNEPFVRCAQAGDADAVERLELDYLQKAAGQLAWARAASQRLWGRPIKHVLLLHIGELNARTLDRLLTQYEKEGARFVSLSDALTDPIYSSPSSTLSSGERTFLMHELMARGLERLAAPPEAPMTVGCAEAHAER